MDKVKTKKYYYKYSVAMYVVYAIFSSVLFACAIFNLCKTLGVGNLVSYYRGLEISAIIVTIIAIVGLTYIMFSNCFIIGDGKFVHQKFFKKVYTADKLLTIKEDKTSGLVVLYVEDETKEDFVGFIVLQVAKNKKDELINDIQSLNSHVSVEVIKGKDEQ